MGIRPTKLFDHMLQNPKKFPVYNELVETYVVTYTSNMYDSEDDLYSFINQNVDKFKEDKESLVRIGKARGLFGYLVKYMLKDPDKKYLKELSKAIIDHDDSDQTKKEVDFLFELSKN
mgnify:CR=1 FL=1